MNERPSSPSPALWTPPQRRAILVLLAILLVVLSIQFWRKPTYVPDPQPVHAPRQEELADRIDPNQADWQTLAALPGIGQRRARDIIAHREQRQQAHPGQVVFRTADDLMHVRGIGPAIVNTLRPHLVFPPPAQRPQHPPDD